MRKALVTGGCGFIGSNLAKKLVLLGWKVDVVDDMSSGTIDALEGLKIKVVPVGLLNVLANNMEISSSDTFKSRKEIDVFVIESDFAHPYLLSHIDKKNYAINHFFHFIVYFFKFIFSMDIF